MSIVEWLENNMQIVIKYQVNKNIYTYYSNKENNPEHLNVIYNEVNVIHGVRCSLTINPTIKVTLLDAYIMYDFDYNYDQRIFCNGYQSWSLSKEYKVDDKLKGLNGIPYIIKKKFGLPFYSDGYFTNYPNEEGRLHGYTYSYIKEDDEFLLIGSLNDKECFTRINHDTIRHRFNVESDIANLELSSSFEVLNYLYLQGKEQEVFDEYFSFFKCKEAKPLNGYCSWYNHYQNINEAILLESIEKNEADLFQIDDGYQTAVGDWCDIDSNKFPNGLKDIIAKAKKKNMLVGIWMAPFVAEKNSKLFKAHPDYFILDKHNKPLYIGNKWSGFYPLDVEKEEVKKYIKNCIEFMIKVLQIDFFKFDFVYAACIKDPKYKTRGKMMSEAMQLLRSICQDKLILGCGVPLASAFEVCDYCRIGADVSLNYKGPFYHNIVNEGPSCKNSLTNTIFRHHLNKKVFLNDPDVYLLRSNNNKLNDKQKNALFVLNHLCGSLFLTSDNKKEYSKESIEIYNKSSKYDNCQILSIKYDRRHIEIRYLDKDNVKHLLVFAYKIGEIIEESIIL